MSEPHTFTVWLDIEEHCPENGPMDSPGPEYVVHDALRIGKAITVDSLHQAEEICHALNYIATALDITSLKKAEEICEAVERLVGAMRE